MDAEMWDKAMQEIINNCARAEDLVAYLYKEATEIEARDFENHARQCASCRSELAAFGNVREAIIDWRQYSLGTVASAASESERAHAFAPATVAYRPGRSALAALREFFTLSPTWMRAASAAAALLFCALVVIAIAYFTEQPKVIVERQSTPASPQEITVTKGAGVVENSNQSRDAVKDNPSAPQQEAMAVNGKSRNEPNKRSASRQPAKKSRQILPRGLNEQSVQLASADDYLPFTSSGAEDRLPSLADLVDDDDDN